MERDKYKLSRSFETKKKVDVKEKKSSITPFLIVWFVFVLIYLFVWP